MSDVSFTPCKYFAIPLINHFSLIFNYMCTSTRFATKDQKEGMSAFAEKRSPNFTHE